MPPRRHLVESFATIGPCAYCGAIDRMTRDHVVPKCRRRAIAPEKHHHTIIMCCRTCNRSKGMFTIDEWVNNLPRHLDPIRVQNAVFRSTTQDKLVRVPFAIVKPCLTYARGGFRLRRFQPQVYQVMSSMFGSYLSSQLELLWPSTAMVEPVSWLVLHEMCARLKAQAHKKREWGGCPPGADSPAITK